MKRDRFLSIDALRGIAALMVLIFHYEEMLYFVPTDQHVNLNVLWTHYGLLGVELFFTISGFVILMSVESTKNLWHFAIGRIARLYPAYLFSVLLTGLYFLLLGEVSLTTVGINLTMLQKFIKAPDLIPPYWSLAYELWFYILIGGIAASGYLHRITWFSLGWFAIAVPLKLFAPNFMSLLTLVQFGHLFIAGIMIYLMTTGRGTPFVKSLLAMCLAYSLLGRTDWSMIPILPYVVACSIFMTLLYLATTGRLERFAPRCLVSLGQVSYSLYLLHIPIGILLTRAASTSGVPVWIALAISIPTSIVAATLSRQYIEKRGQAFIQNLDFQKLSSINREGAVSS